MVIARPTTAMTLDDVVWQERLAAATGYTAAVEAMERRVAAIREGMEPEMVWILEHPPLYTAGTSARPQDLLDPDRFPVFRAGRGSARHEPGIRAPIFRGSRNELDS